MGVEPKGSRELTDAERKTLLSLAREHLSNYSIGFVRLNLRDGVEAATQAGSGTLVRADGCPGILTADHVLSNLPDSGLVGLILSLRGGSAIQRPTIRMEGVRKIRLGPASYDRNGPDLALGILRPSDVSSLGANEFL
jgi:hypothetical protein